MEMIWHDSADKFGASKMKKLSSDAVKGPEWK
jgi:hypothetical protein